MSWLLPCCLKQRKAAQKQAAQKQATHACLAPNSRQQLAGVESPSQEGGAIDRRLQQLAVVQ